MDSSTTSSSNSTENSEQIPESLIKWIDDFASYQPVDWDRLPELELYMDQVITYINRQFEALSADGERVLSPSMINNYVKDGVLPRPEKKRYNRDHLAMLLMICSLKPVLQLPEIDETLRGLTDSSDMKTQYPVFAQMHANIVNEISQLVSQAGTQDASTRYLLALQLALDANARRIAAVRLLNSINTDEEKNKKEK